MEQVAHQAPHFIIVWYGQVLTRWCDLCQTFRDIQAIKVIISIYLSKNKYYGEKTVVTVEPGTGNKYIM
jgi:hypothetical protein